MTFSWCYTCNESILWPAAEPVHGATGDQRWELERSVAELLPDWREAQDHMEMVSHTWHEVVVEVLVGRRPLGEFSLHDGDKIAEDLVNLVPSEQVGHLRSKRRGRRRNESYWKCQAAWCVRLVPSVPSSVFISFHSVARNPSGFVTSLRKIWCFWAKKSQRRNSHATRSLHSQ